jgi:hypothetical protein
MREKRIELSLRFFFSLRYLCGLCVSAVNGLTDIETINDKRRKGAKKRLGIS